MMMQPGMPPQGGGLQQEAAEIQAEERRINAMKSNSYHQRMLEGRPVHSLLSQVTVIVAVFCLLFQGGAFAYTDWRNNRIGTLGYSRRRQWGILGIKGDRFQTYTEQRSTACAIWGEFHIFAACMTPLCKWYQQKCLTYMEFEYAMIGLAVVLGIVMLIQLCVAGWFIQLTPRTIKMAFCWEIVAWILHMGCVICYVIGTDMMFDELLDISYYPTPYLGWAFFGAAFSNTLMITVLVLGWRLKDTWPEPDSDSEYEDEDEDEDDRPKHHQQQQQQPMGQPMGQPMMGAAQPMMMQQQQQPMMVQQQQQQPMMMQQQVVMDQQPMMAAQDPHGAMEMPQAPPAPQ